MKHLLFICSRNRLRSPTAEAVFSSYPDIKCSSAGIATDVMERNHERKLKKKFGSALQGKRVICLGIPDEYDYMDPALVAELEARVPSFIS
jgi:predicted protein tyrosine phosphatase